MTVIVTLISKHCTVHATDSLITCVGQDGDREILEAEQTKIVPIHKFRGAIAYWGLAQTSDGWSTYDWLDQQARTKAAEFDYPEDFARYLTDSLNAELAKMRFQYPIESGIGIHFTAYEHINDYWIPELFVLSNFSDPTYSGLHREVLLSRQTTNVMLRTEPQPEHSGEFYRLLVHGYLQSNGMLLYNNGDPLMFSPTASVILEQMELAKRRNKLVDSDDVATYRKMARMPIEIVAEIQRQLYRSGTRLVGGKIHDYSITPNGIPGSDSGDAS